MSRIHQTVFVLTLALLLGLAAVPAQAQDILAQEVADHYKCYEIVSSDVFEPFPVQLRDQFGITEAEVVRALYVCNPVDKNNEGILHPEVHQVCYEIRDPLQPTRNLLVSNQFGELTVKVQDARLLCVPSKKIHLDDTQPVE